MIVIVGKNGQVAWELQRILAPLRPVCAFGSQEANLTDPDAIIKIIRANRPAVIINAAAHTAVDLAERERDVAMHLNGTIPGILAEEAKKLNATFVHYSTDYVFDGTAISPYLETALPQPLGVYGASKLAGELAIQQVGGRYLILRTSWVYGGRGKNFLRTILQKAEVQPELRIVNDQIGCPTWSRTIAEATSRILSQITSQIETQWGVYNLVSQGQTSWCGFAEQICTIWGNLKGADWRMPEITGIPSSAYPSPAKRPAYSVLSTDKIERTFSLQLPNWKDALSLCLIDMHAQNRPLA